MGTELIIGTGTSLTLPARHSNDYAAWLVIELGRLAAYLGKSDALDEEGYRASEMAKDLKNTVPAVMEAALKQLRQATTFFPTTDEIRKAYTLAAKNDIEAGKANKRAKDEAEQEQARVAIAAGTGEYFSADAFLAEHTKQLTDFGTLATLRRQTAAAPRIAIPEPKVELCPHCGKGIPFGIADLRILTAGDLRSMADRRDAEAVERAASVEKAQQYREPKPTPAKKRTKRNG